MKDLIFCSDCGLPKEDCICNNNKNLSSFNRQYDELINGEIYIDTQKVSSLQRDYEKLYEKIREYSKDYTLNTNEDLEAFLNNYSNLNDEEFIKILNNEYVNNELEKNKEFFDKLDDKVLDLNQRIAIVTDEFNTQIIAGAGTGKSTTIAAKIKYLIEKKDVNPDKILCISYSNASVNDLKKKIPQNVQCNTFHRLGINILEDNGFYFNIDNYAFKKFLNEYFVKKIIHNEEICNKILHFYSDYYNNHITKGMKTSSLNELFNMEDEKSFNFLKKNYNKNHDISTLNLDMVRSIEELIISNFLFGHGIKYEYEKPYEIINKDFKIQKESFKNVLFEEIEDGIIPESIKEELSLKLIPKTDLKMKISFEDKSTFYLPEYDIYLEHFEVNKNCQALWLNKKECREYREQITWKRNLHKEHKTKLIETYSYYMCENRLLDRLKEKLEAENLSIPKINYQKVFREIIKKKNINNFSNLMNLIENFIELFKGNHYKISKFREFKKENEKEPVEFNKKRNTLFLDIVEDAFKSYEKFLEENNKIDFNDMINRATELVNKSPLSDNFKYEYILIDEYQDTSYTRYELIKALQNKSNCKVCVVGDDWQSIYRFTGCDINLFTNFEKYFDKPEKLFIKNTYRNCQELINISSDFIKKNKDQSQKNLKSYKHRLKPVKIAYYSNVEKNLIFEYLINECSKTSNNILILGRNKKDIHDYINNHYSQFKREKNNKNSRKNEDNNPIIYKKNKNLKIKYSTMHSSKGLEQDNVILINLEKRIDGFPNKIEDDDVMKFVKNNTDYYKYAEERRLFYVALTRTRNNVYLLVPNYRKSEFIAELLRDPEKLEIISKKKIREFNKKR